MTDPAHNHGDDGALVLAVQGGDGDAFAELFRRHYPDVRRACAGRLFDATEADEAAQAAFVRAFERIHQCSGERRFGPWVHVIARSICMDAFRAKARVEPFEQPLPSRREHRPNEPEESVLTSERAAHVHQALSTLPDRQRRAVIARNWDEQRPREIAETLGLSVGAVDSLLLRARRRLAESYRLLAGEGGGGASGFTVRSAAAAAVVALVLGPQALVGAAATAAHAAQHTAARAADGVVGAIVAVAVTMGVGGEPPDARRPVPPAAVVTTAVQEPAGPAVAPPPPPATEAGAARGAAPAAGATSRSTPPAPPLVTSPAGAGVAPAADPPPVPTVPAAPLVDTAPATPLLDDLPLPAVRPERDRAGDGDPGPAAQLPPVPVDVPPVAAPPSLPVTVPELPLGSGQG